VVAPVAQAHPGGAQELTFAEDTLYQIRAHFPKTGREEEHEEGSYNQPKDGRGDHGDDDFIPKTFGSAALGHERPFEHRPVPASRGNGRAAKPPDEGVTGAGREP